jgi:GH35 family endo-1,4-beta-xylanase
MVAEWIGATNSSAVCGAELPVPSGPRFKDLAPIDGSARLLVGASIDVKCLETQSEANLKRDFQFLTPANEFKQAAVHPEPGVWRWKKADQMSEYCAQRGYLVRLHAPLSPQCSAWAEEDHRTPEELLQNLEEYMTAVCQRYNGKPHVRWMDVVNETVTDKGEWFGPKPGVGKWQNPWTQIGFDDSHPLRPPLYIKRAFELANQHAPDIKLLINQHAGMEQSMWEKIKATVLYLREKGLRIDGIGWQGHVDAGWELDPDNLRRLNELIAWAHANQLEFHVTENTVWMKGKNIDNEAAQAATFAAIVRTLIQHRHDGVVTWNAWQLRDQDIQRPELKGTMFHADGSPKQAYFAVQRELQALQPEGTGR